ncbi:MAG: hypothetical protein KA314_10925 [Chloroflexi bacterium]|nr:hypothetical protein [Chloroflexota bacterium]MBP8056347.1 hypothetical protein [Chloroflexota bacterium]
MVTLFAEKLTFYVHRSAYSAGQLAHLSGVPKMTIVHWLEGRVARPRRWQPLVQLLAALRLSEVEANEVLGAAGHPIVRALQAQVRGGEEERLLVYWLLDQRSQRTPFQVIADVPVFVGREGLLAELQAALRGGHHPAPYVLYGMAGVGKTTLAVHLAYRVREMFPDGVLWARPHLSDPLTILATFAWAYGQEVGDYADGDSRGRVVRDILADKRALILLDDVITWAEIQPLLPPTGSCAVLLTTQQREVAARPGVKAWEVKPFAAADSLALFAQVGDAGWVAQHEAELQEVAERLGYWPLAVGLVASRLAFEPAWVAEQFLAQLRQSAWPTALNDIQQTIHQTLDLLVARLSPQAKGLLPLLGLMGVHEFAENAAAILSDLAEPALAVYELVSRSFLQAVRPRRVRWHPLVQSYIQTHFPADESQIDRFVAYSLELARSGQMHELDREQGHLTQTRQMVWQRGQWQTWAQFMVRLWPYWEQRGLYRLIGAEVRERLDWLQKHIAADDALWRDWVWSPVWVIRAKLARFEHDYDAAAVALAVAAALAQPAYQGEVWLERGVLANYREDNVAAARCFAEGMALARQFRQPQLMAQLLKELGILALEKNNLAQMEQLYREALSLSGQDQFLALNLLRGLGTLHFFKGERDTAFQFYAQSLAMARELDVRDGMVHGLNNLAVIFVLREQWAQADKQLDEAEQLAETIGHRQTMALLRYNRALLTWYQGDAAATRTYLHQAQQIAQAISSTRLLRRIENTLEGLDAAAPPTERLILFYD